MWEQTTELQNELTAALIGTFALWKHTGRERSLPIGTASPKLLHSEKITSHAKMFAKEHHQDVEFRHPLCANTVISHCAMLASLWSTTEKGMSRFKIEGEYRNYFFSILQILFKILT
jgi:hypothetical protein